MKNRNQEPYPPGGRQRALPLEVLCYSHAFPSEYWDIDRELRDYPKHTDRQLRNLNKEKKSVLQELWQGYRFDVVRDAYEVDLDSETSITMPRNGGCGRQVPRPLTRKDKRKLRKEGRARRRDFSKNLICARGEIPRSVSGEEDRSFTPVVAAK
jgi:hypothetical protein